MDRAIAADLPGDRLVTAQLPGGQAPTPSGYRLSWLLVSFSPLPTPQSPFLLERKKTAFSLSILGQ